MPPNMPLNPLEATIMGINTNPYFIGLMMLLLNLGGRFLGLEITKEQEKVLQHPWVRRGLFFTVLFVATRNIMVALVMTIFVVLFVSVLFNENSDYYLGRSMKSMMKPSAAENGAPVPGLTPEEQEILRRLMEKQARLMGGAQGQQPNMGEQSADTKEPFEAELVYMKNIQKLSKV
jgi:hypothetical protein